MAADMRQLASAHISAQELERMGDHAEGIARREPLALADMTPLARCFAGVVGPDDRSLAAWLAEA